MINNAANTTLDQNSGTTPNVSGAMDNWYQPMIFGIIVKSTVNFELQETISNLSFQGLWQPLRPQQLKMKPEGERKWRWFQVFSNPALVLDIDSIITYLGTNYRVMGKEDFSLEGYARYELLEDYENFVGD